MAMRYIVQKPLPTADGVLPAGVIVAPAGWRNLPLLVEQRFLKMVEQVSEQLEPVKRGRPKKERIQNG